MAEIKKLIEDIAKSIVDKPDSVEVTEIDGEENTVIEIRVAKEDLGKVIGKEGKTVRALRTILAAASARIRRKAVLEIIE